MNFGNSFRVAIFIGTFGPRVGNPGLKFNNAFGVAFMIPSFVND